MITQLAHVCIAADDLDVTLKFYREGLGFTKAFDFLRGGKVIGHYIAVPGGTYIEVFQRADIDRNAPAPIQHLCFLVDDIDRTSSVVRSLGYDVTDKIMGADRSWQAWTKDPGGVIIEFHQYTARSSQKTGADCVLD